MNEIALCAIHRVFASPKSEGVPGDDKSDELLGLRRSAGRWENPVSENPVSGVRRRAVVDEGEHVAHGDGGGIEKTRSHFDHRCRAAMREPPPVGPDACVEGDDVGLPVEQNHVDRRSHAQRVNGRTRLQPQTLLWCELRNAQPADHPGQRRPGSNHVRRQVRAGREIPQRRHQEPVRSTSGMMIAVARYGAKASGCFSRR